MKCASMPGLASLAMLALLGHLVATAPATAEPVFIKGSGGEGKGFTVADGGKCYVIAPEHVADSDTPLDIIGPGRTAAKGSMIKSFGKYAGNGLNVDVAIVELSGKSGLPCSDPKPSGTEIEKALKKASEITLKQVAGNGQTNQRYLKLRTYDETSLRASPADRADAAVKSDSGSLLLANGVPVGLVRALDTKEAGKSGDIIAIRYDVVINLVDNYFKSLRDAAGSTFVLHLKPIVMDGKLVRSLSANQKGSDSMGTEAFTEAVSDSLAFELRDMPTVSDVRTGPAVQPDANFVINPKVSITAIQAQIANNCRKNADGTLIDSSGTCYGDWKNVASYSKFIYVVAGDITDARSNQKYPFRTESEALVPEQEGLFAKYLRDSLVRETCVAVKDAFNRSGVIKTKIRGDPNSLIKAGEDVFAEVSKMFGAKGKSKVRRIC